MYEIKEEGVKKTVYLLDEVLNSYRKAEKENKEFIPKMKIKIELKINVMYEGWKKMMQDIV